MGECWFETADSYGNDFLSPWFHIQALAISPLRFPYQAQYQHLLRGDRLVQPTKRLIEEMTTFQAVNNTAPKGGGDVRK